MSFGSKGDTAKTTFGATTTPQFPSFIQQPLESLIPQLQQLSGQAPQLDPNAQGLLSGILGGDFLTGGPGFETLMGEAERQILPGVISQFAGAGRGRSGLAGEAAARGLGGAFSSLVSGERQRQLQALPFAFGQAQAPFNQQFGLLQALLGAPVGQTQTGTQSSTQIPGRLSSIGQIASLAAPFAFGFSDRRLKRNIRRVGEMFGFPAYEFEYVWSVERHIGVMADEVRAKVPEAVIEGPYGLEMVNYAMLEAKYGRHP